MILEVANPCPRGKRESGKSSQEIWLKPDSLSPPQPGEYAETVGTGPKFVFRIVFEKLIHSHLNALNPWTPILQVTFTILNNFEFLKLIFL